MRNNLFACLLIIIFSLPTYAQEAKIKLIFDNDAANDDFTALIYLLRHPKVDVQAITIAGTGEAHGPVGAKNAADLCYMMMKPNIPIAYGSANPLDNAVHFFPDNLRKLMDEILIANNIPHHPTPNITNSAVELIKKIVTNNQEKTTILATGPLTNIAEFIKKYPTLTTNIDKIIMMGGAVNVKGNIRVLINDTKNDVAEWNIYADPKAAQIVFSSGIPIVLVPLDATNQVPMTQTFYDDVAREQLPGLKLIHAFMKVVVDNYGMDLFLNDFYLWDTLAAMITVDANIAEYTMIPIIIDVDLAQTKPVLLNTPGSTVVRVATFIREPQKILKQLVYEIANALTSPEFKQVHGA